MLLEQRRTDSTHLEVTREQMLHEWDGPLLERFGKNSVVSVTKRLLNNCVPLDLIFAEGVPVQLTVPGIIPLQPFDINQDSEKLRNGKGWVGIVELDSDLVGKLLPGALALLESADDVVERRGTPEVLLLQPELLSTLQTTVVRCVLCNLMFQLTCRWGRVQQRWFRRAVVPLRSSRTRQS